MAVQQVEAEPRTSTPDLVVETVSRPRSLEQPAPATPDGQESVRQALGAVATGLGRQLERRLPSLIVAALGALFSQAVEKAIRERIDEAVHAALAHAFEAFPVIPASEDVQREAEDAICSILHDLLDSLFAGTIRTELECHGREVTEALLRQDTAAARETIEAASAATLRDALDIVKDHRGEVTRALLTVLAKATTEAAATTIANGAEDAAATPVEAVSKAVSKAASGTRDPDTERRGETVKDDSRPDESRTEQGDRPPARKQLGDQGQTIRDQMGDIGDTLRRQIEQETKGLKDRLTGGVQEGTKQGMRNQQLGRPPSARSSSRSTPGRPPGRRGPPGRPPSAR